MLCRAVTASFALLAFTTLSFAQGKPNLSGTWKLNTTKSDFGVIPGPDSQVNVIEHNDPSIKIDMSQVGAQGAQNFTMRLSTDGKEVVNTIGPREAKSTASWDGPNLVVNTNLKFNDQDVSIKSIWSVSEDGKTLTQNAHYNSPMGEMDQKLIFEKQEGGAAVAAKAPEPPAAHAPAAPGNLSAAGRPNFTGTWKLNAAKSDFGPIPGPDSATDIVEHNDPALKVNVSLSGAQGDQNYTLNLTTDGKETTNSAGGTEVKSTSVWQGNNLVTNSKLKLNDQDLIITSTWSLSADGKTMTQDIHYNSPMGEADQKFLFDKQDSGPAATAPAMPKSTTTAPSVAGAHPNFSGVWKLNTAKSDFGVMPGPDLRTDTIEHTDPTLKLSRKENGPEGPREYVLTLTTDGKETVNNLGGADAKISAIWDGPGLIINFKLKLQDQDISVRQVATLSPDGKTLTNKAHVSMSMGEMDQVEVYDRQQ